MAAPGKWSHGFWGCCTPWDDCLCSCFCPCIVFGRNSARLKDPSDKSPSGFNGDCCFWAILACCSLQCVIQTMKRGDIRNQYSIDGSCPVDCLASTFCPCCGLVQESKEVKLRAESAQAYQPPEGMKYTS